RPLGVSQNESVHPKLESQPSPDENPESQQTLGGVAPVRSYAHPEPELWCSGREERAELVCRDFSRVGGGKMPDAKTMGRGRF
ncbi:hypothetical protein ABIB06_007799, partial [Bradyrhizobium sp. LB8.2]